VIVSTMTARGTVRRLMTTSSMTNSYVGPSGRSRIALDRIALADPAVLDPHSAAFAGTARTLTLATTAALTTVLTAHRYGRDARDRRVCLPAASTAAGRPAPLPSDNILVIDRHGGTLTEWPRLDTDTLAREYRDYPRGALDADQPNIGVVP